MTDRSIELMEEKQLIIGCLEGEADDFKKIVERYSAQVMAMALNILGNREDAEDACQEAFIQVYCNLENYDSKRSFKNWLYTIIYHRSLDQLRKRHRNFRLLNKMRVESSALCGGRTSNPSGNQLLPQNILKILKPKERIALCLWANEGYRAEEVSEVLGCSSSTARVYLFKARRKVKAQLEKENVSFKNY